MNSLNLYLRHQRNKAHCTYVQPKNILQHLQTNRQWLSNCPSMKLGSLNKYNMQQNHPWHLLSSATITNWPSMNYRMMATENEHFNKHPQHAIFASDTFWGGNNYIDTFEMHAHTFCDQNLPKLPKPTPSKPVKVRLIYLPISPLVTRLTSIQQFRQDRACGLALSWSISDLENMQSISDLDFWFLILDNMPTSLHLQVWTNQSITVQTCMELIIQTTQTQIPLLIRHLWQQRQQTRSKTTTISKMFPGIFDNKGNLHKPRPQL